ncbi:MAG: hypothetical protein R6W91_07530 [Thermoplasmata archaeon]
MNGRVLPLIVAILILGIIITGMAGASDSETVYISQGGHYASGPFYTWDTADLWVNVTVQQGGPVDVYIMSYSQYENAYLFEGGEPNGISFKNVSRENITQANIYYHLAVEDRGEMWGGEDIFVVVDNRETEATPHDADPDGNSVVLLEVNFVADDSFFEDDFFWFEGILCIAGSLLPVIIIIVLLLLIYTKMDRKNNAPPQYPQPYYPPPFNPPGNDMIQGPPPGEFKPPVH